MGLLQSIISFCSGLPDDAPQWDQLKQSGARNNESRLARLHQKETDARLKALRKVFAAKLSELHNSVVQYGRNVVEIHYIHWPIREGKEELVELERLCRQAKVTVSYVYPYYYMCPAE